MSVLNAKSGLNRLFPFAKKKPNIPTKLTDKVETKSNKPKLVEDKNVSIVKTTDLIRSDVLTENNEKAKSSIEKTCSDEIPIVVAEAFKEILSQNDDSEIKLKSISLTRKSSTVSVTSIDGIKKPKENYQRWNIPFSSKFKGQDFDKTLLTMQDLIYYNPVTNPIIKTPKIELKEDDDDPDNDLLPIKSDEKPSLPNNCITPCIKVGADGKIIIDQETLTLNETGLEEKREELAKAKVIEESAFQLRSYKSNRKKEPSKQWTKNDTLKFYKCLMNLGTDFSIIEQYFPGRTRAQIKRKYKTEEKKNPDLINSALTHTTHYDSVLIENMFVEDEEDKPEEVKPKPKEPRKRRHANVKRSDCSKMSVCAYMMEEEIVLKNKKKPPTKVTTAKDLKPKLLSLQSIKNKKRTRGRPPKDKTVSPEVDEKPDEPIPKVRRLQDFHDEYEETITQYEDNSNSE